MYEENGSLFVGLESKEKYEADLAKVQTFIKEGVEEDSEDELGGWSKHAI